MLRRELITDETTIVVLGKFNPAIFHPAWFARYKLARDNEMLEAKVRYVDNNLMQFSVDWFQLRVTGNQFFISSTDPSNFLALRDLVRGTFELLLHTPMHELGFNRVHKYRFESEDEWHSLGHTLAPKDRWNLFMQDTGLRVMQIEGKREDSLAEKVFVKLGTAETSTVFVHTNYHYRLENPEGESTTKLSFLLANEWDPFLLNTSKIPDQIIDDGQTNVG